MRKLIKKILKWLNQLVPHAIRIRTDPAAYGINRFMRFIAMEVKPTDRVLDAGAGSRPYKNYFSHAKYQSTDRDHKLIEGGCLKEKHTFICSLENLPNPDNSYDVVINTQVLEHVQYPQRVINEFFRILKPGGSLFLTAPQGWGVHGAPYHYFNFTKYGLESLFNNAGFNIIFIEPMGGMFWYLAKRIRTLPNYIFSQYVFKGEIGSEIFKPGLKAYLLTPFYFLSIPICVWIIPLACFYLDKLDKKRDYTLNYACCCKKP